MVLNQGWGTPGYAYGKERQPLSCSVSHRPALLRLSRIVSRRHRPLWYGCYSHPCATHANIYNAHTVIHASFAFASFFFSTDAFIFSRLCRTLSDLSGGRRKRIGRPIHISMCHVAPCTPAPVQLAKLFSIAHRTLRFHTIPVSLPTTFLRLIHTFFPAVTPIRSLLSLPSHISPRLWCRSLGSHIPPFVVLLSPPFPWICY